MPALVETMFYVRETPWHGLGTKVDAALTSGDAIKQAGLDWKVISTPIFDPSGKEILGYKANTRDSDNKVLGVVTDKYQIVQNSKAFEFTDSLITDEVVKYETAGSLRGGKQIWLLAKMPEKKILDDNFDPYICFTNTHDGTGAIRVCMTPIRVVCNNTLNLALSSAKRSWSTKHIGDMDGKLAEAKETMGLANAYMDALNETAQKMSDIKVTDARLEQILDELYPVDPSKDTSRRLANVNDLKDKIYTCYCMPDIQQYKGTAWGVINAMTDMADHMTPARMTDTYQENNWGRIMIGHPLVDLVYNKLMTKIN